ncbi:MAG: DUF6576 domain-containing protein [Fidelibacterota bacterium]
MRFKWTSGKKESKNKQHKKKPKNSEEEELDELMDRIARKGYESLNEEEKVRLLELTGKYKHNE